MNTVFGIGIIYDRMIAVYAVTAQSIASNCLFFQSASRGKLTRNRIAFKHAAGRAGAPPNDNSPSVLK